MTGSISFLAPLYTPTSVFSALPRRAYQLVQQVDGGGDHKRRAVAAVDGLDGYEGLACSCRQHNAAAPSRLFPGHNRFLLVVVWLAAVIQGAVQMLPARDDVARIEMFDPRVVIRLAAPFAFDPLKGRTGGIGLWSVGDNESALEGEGRSIRHSNMARFHCRIFYADGDETPTASLRRTIIHDDLRAPMLCVMIRQSHFF